MSNLVYLISSLPNLNFGQIPPMSLDSFHDDAKAQLSSKHFEELHKCDLKNIAETDTKSLKTFNEIVSQLNADFKEIRKAKRNEQVPALAILSKNELEKNPLEREKGIMKMQWDELTGIDSSETFSFTELLVYKLKLQILHRLNSFNTEKGLEILDKVVEPSMNLKEK